MKRTKRKNIIFLSDREAIEWNVYTNKSNNSLVLILILIFLLVLNARSVLFCLMWSEKKVNSSQRSLHFHLFVMNIDFLLCLWKERKEGLLRRERRLYECLRMLSMTSFSREIKQLWNWTICEGGEKGAFKKPQTEGLWMSWINFRDEQNV